MTEKCVQCGKDFGGNWPSCHQIENDQPQLLQITEANGWKIIVENTLRRAHKLRCEFMDFLIQRSFAKPDPQNAGLYILPDDIELRPLAMIELEEQIIAMAVNTDHSKVGGIYKGKFQDSIEMYEDRTKAFFENQYRWLMNIEPETN